MVDSPQTDPNPSRPKTIKIIALVILVILLVALVVLIQQKRKSQNPPPSPTPPISKKATTPTSTVEVIAVENGKPSLYLPKDIVLEKDAMVLKSTYTKPFFYQPTVYQIRSELSFVSKRSLDENFSLYKKYFENNKWQITSSINEKELKRLTVIKGSDKINVLISQNSLTKEEIIDISGIHTITYRSSNQATSTPTTTPTKK